MARLLVSRDIAEIEPWHRRDSLSTNHQRTRWRAGLPCLASEHSHLLNDRHDFCWFVCRSSRMLRRNLFPSREAARRATRADFKLRSPVWLTYTCRRRSDTSTRTIHSQLCSTLDPGKLVLYTGSERARKWPAGNNVFTNDSGSHGSAPVSPPSVIAGVNTLARVGCVFGP